MAVAETAQLIVDLRLQDQLSPGAAQARASIAGLEAQATKTSSGLSTLGSSVKTLALGFGGLVAAQKVADFLGDAVTKAREDEQSVAALTASLKANVPAWSGVTTAIEAQIKSAQQLGFTDDEVRGSIQRLVAVTHDVGQAIAIQATAMDLARFKGISLQDATEALVRVEAGRYRALADLGIQVKANATQSEALAAVQKVASGQAEAFGKTSAGAAKAAAIAFDEMQESIGRGLLPTLDSLVQKLNQEVIPALGRAGDAAAPFIKGVHDVNEEAKKASGGVDLLGIATTSIGGVVNKAGDAFHDMMSNVLAWNRSIYGSTPVLDALNGSINGTTSLLGILGPAFSGVGNVIDTVTGSLHAGTTAIDEMSGSFITLANNVDEKTGAFADDFNAMQKPIADTTAEVSALDAAIAMLPSDVQIKIHVQTVAEGAGGRNVAEKIGTATDIATGAGDPTIAQANADFLRDNAARQKAIDDARAADRKAAADKAASEAKAAADKAAAEARQRAQELAQANREKVAASYDDVKTAADRLFNSLHDRHIQAIRDAEALSQKQHDAAIKRIDDALKVQEAENAKPADTAEKAQNAREQAEARRNLVESLQAAQQAQLTNTDPARAADLARSVRDATEALQNFDARATIGRLRGTEGALNAQAEAQAQKDRDKADADLEQAKARAAAEDKAVTAADKKKSDDFGRALDALRKKDEQDPRKFLTDAKALEARFGIFTDERGFRHIGDAVAASVAKVKITPTIHVQNKFSVTLNGRDIAAAVATANQPSAAPGVRTGQAGRAA